MPSMRSRLLQQIREAKRAGDRDKVADLKSLLEQADIPESLRAAAKGLRSIGGRVPKRVRKRLLATGLLRTYRTSGGTECVASPIGDSPEILQEMLAGEIAGSYEATIAELRDTVREYSDLFGGSDSEYWMPSLEATFGSLVIVRGAGDHIYRATWRRITEGGAITFSDVEEVDIVVRTGGGDRRVTLEREELRETFEAPVQILEEVDRPHPGGVDHLMTVECVLGIAEVPTANDRVYPQALFEHLVAESAAGTDRSKGWMAEAGHPEDGYPRLQETVSTPWRDLRMEGDTLLGTTTILDTSRGADVQKQIRNGVPVQVSSRAFGTLTPKIEEARTLYMVDEVSTFEHWGGWDLVLGAAASARVTSYKESHGQPAAAVQDSGEGPGESIDEALEDMTEAELRALLKEQQEKVEAAILPLLEKFGIKAAAVGDPAGGGDGAGDGGDPPAADNAVLIAEVQKMGIALETHITSLAEEKKATATAVALTASRKAILETDVVGTWPAPAKALLERELGRVEDPTKMGDAFKAAQEMLVETGILVITQPSGAGHILDTSTGERPGVQGATSAVEVQKERAQAWRTGRLAVEHLPATVDELLDLATAHIEDNGVENFDPDPQNPMTEWLDRNSPFRGFHPGNERHVMKALLQNTIAADNRTAMPHLRGYAEQPLFKTMLEWTGVGNVVNSTPYILPLITQVFPKIIATQLCSVQPMNKPTGRVHYLDFLYDPSMADPSQQQHWVSDYAQNVSEQAVIPQMMLQIVGYDMLTDTKKLHAEWSTEVMQDLRAEHGLDIASLMLSAMSDEIAREINQFLLDVMLNNADPHYGVVTAGNQNYGTQIPAAAAWPNGTLAEWRKEIYTAIIAADLNVQNARYRPTNWIVASPTALTYLTRCEGWKAWTADDESREWNVGINRVGSIEGSPGWKIFVSQGIAQNTMLLGRKGSDWPDAGMVYSPYIPIYTTPVLTEPRTLCNREAVMSRFGYRKVIGNMFATLTVQPGVPGIPIV